MTQYQTITSTDTMLRDGTSLRDAVPLQLVADIMLQGKPVAVGPVGV